MIAYRALLEWDGDSPPPPVLPQGLSDRDLGGYSASFLPRVRAQSAFFVRSAVFFADCLVVFLSLFNCERFGFDGTRRTGSLLEIVFSAISNPKSAERSSPPPSTLAAAGPFFESERLFPALAISSFSSTL